MATTEPTLQAVLKLAGFETSEELNQLYSEVHHDTSDGLIFYSLWVAMNDYAFALRNYRNYLDSLVKNATKELYNLDKGWTSTTIWLEQSAENSVKFLAKMEETLNIIVQLSTVRKLILEGK